MLTINVLKEIIEKAKVGNVYHLKSRMDRANASHVIKIAEELKLIKKEEATLLSGRGIEIVTLTDEYKKLLCGP